jgi:3-hydroxyacyl-CoA dehydrogenase
MDKGSLGNKAKRGFFMKDPKTKAFYEYEIKTGEYVPVVNEPIDALEAVKKLPIEEKIRQLVYGDSVESKYIWENTKELLAYTADHTDEICNDYKDIDNALKWGYNWKFGPFEIWDIIGIDKSIKRMEAEGRTVASWVKERAKKGLKFYEGSEHKKTPYIILSDYNNSIVAKNDAAVIKDIGDGVLCFELISKGNTVSYATTEMLQKAHELLATDKYDGMVIGNNGSLFSGGFNLAEASAQVFNKDWDGLTKSLDRFHDLLLKNKYSTKPIVSAVFGSAVGGGMELAIQTSYVVAHPETNMGLVEAGVGLIPGGGGTKELAVRADQMSNGGELNNLVLKFWQDMATASVTSSAFDALNRGFLKKENTKIVMGQNYLISEAKKMVLSLNQDGFRVPIKKKVRVAGVAGRGFIDSVIDSMVKGNFATAYDAVVAGKIAHIVTGGNVPRNALVTEEYLNELEKEAFLSLLGEEKTIARIKFMLETRKPLRN